MKPRKWDTPRLALFGAAVGAILAVIPEADRLAELGAVAAVSLGIGGAAGGAALFAAIAGVRNMFAR